MVRLTAVAIAALALGLAALAGGLERSTPARALTNCSTSTQALDSAEQELIRLINEFRAANGRQPLKPSPNLSRAAAWMSEDMVANGYFSHTDSLGRSPFQRVRDCGYASSGAGENLAMAGSASTAFNLWLNSSGHRANMLNSMWVVIGVGRAGPYWTVDFGNVDDSGQSWDSLPPPAPTATPTPTPTPPPTSAATPPPTATSPAPPQTTPPPGPPPGSGSANLQPPPGGAPTGSTGLPRRITLPNLGSDR